MSVNDAIPCGLDPRGGRLSGVRAENTVWARFPQLTD
jgi:hypothetical protein